MSIARAFTTRRVKHSLTLSEADVRPHRSNTTKVAGSIRHKISAPVELIYTTNMLSYNAPDILRTASSTSSSHRSDDDSDHSPHTAASTPPTSPDTESPSLSPEPNHLSCYFTVPGQPAATSPAPKTEAPVIPLRAPSHSKKSYDSLVRQRSSSRMSEQSQRSLQSKASFSFSRSSSSSTSTTATSVASTPPQNKMKAPIQSAIISSQPTTTTPPPTMPQVNHRKEFSQAQHPFGPELAQVTEIAEEYGIKEQLNEVAVEEQELAAKGLSKFSANDYLSEIHGLFTSFFPETKPMATAMWI
ncbi:hypothetical protein B0T14DRAFT_66161 [Immersiella caudata]|uniref:Uncharacterized protein n=1 Tax=Immersiella caudata TaxID=314043 RepID=A0AA39XG63_9PEZI|nr:hypothetical protein B0T14DRAFT_66161 [Immersiella caudata]